MRKSYHHTLHPEKQGEGRFTKLSFLRETQQLSLAPNRHLATLRSNDLDSHDTEPAKQEEEMNYKNMPDLNYFLTTLVFYIIIILGACFIDNVDIIFDFMGSLGYSFLGFIFPAMAYLGAVKEQEKIRITQKDSSTVIEPSKTLIWCCYIQFILGIASVGLGIANNVQNIISD